MSGIIPKPIKREPKWQSIAFYAVLALLVMTVLSYATLFYFESKALNTLSFLEEQISQIGTDQDKEIEQEIFDKKKTIEDFETFFADHNKTTGFFEFLESNAHPTVWFTQLSLKPKEMKAILSGQTINFQTLGQQLLILKNQAFVNEIELSDLTINDEGDVEFIFSLSLDPQIFK